MHCLTESRQMSNLVVVHKVTIGLKSVNYQSLKFYIILIKLYPLPVLINSLPNLHFKLNVCSS
jgi:hypothetical protein